MVTRTIEKNLAGLEDLLIGNGDQMQSRGGTNYVITKHRPQHVVDVIAELQDVVYTKLTSVRVLAGTVIGDNNGGLYYWDSTSIAIPNGSTVVQVTGVVKGRWLLVTNTATESYEGSVILANEDEAEAGVTTTVLQCKNMESAFKSILPGYNKSGTHSSYTADVDDIDYNSIFAVTGTTVANLPWTTAEKGFLYTDVHAITTDRTQKVINIETDLVYTRHRIASSWSAWLTKLKGFTLLSNPQLLVNSSASNSWTTQVSSTLADAGATSGVFRVVMTGFVTGVKLKLSANLKKTDTNPSQFKVLHLEEHSSASTNLEAEGVAECTCAVTELGSFDWLMATTGTLGGQLISVYLLGYHS